MFNNEYVNTSIKVYIVKLKIGTNNPSILILQRIEDVLTIITARLWTTTTSGTASGTLEGPGDLNLNNSITISGADESSAKMTIKVVGKTVTFTWTNSNHNSNWKYFDFIY